MTDLGQKATFFMSAFQVVSDHLRIETSVQKQSEVLFVTVACKGTSCPRNSLFYTIYICIDYIDIYEILITRNF